MQWSYLGIVSKCCLWYYTNSRESINIYAQWNHQKTNGSNDFRGKVIYSFRLDSLNIRSKIWRGSCCNDWDWKLCIENVLWYFRFLLNYVLIHFVNLSIHKNSQGKLTFPENPFKETEFLLYLSPFDTKILFLYPWKRSNTRGFLMFSPGIERKQWHQMG